METTPTVSDDRGTWWRVTAASPLLREPFVDWYRASDQAGALELWAEDAHRYGVPADVTVKECRAATADEAAALVAFVA